MAAKGKQTNAHTYTYTHKVQVHNTFQSVLTGMALSFEVVFELIRHLVV